MLLAQFANSDGRRGTEPFDHSKNALRHERIFPQGDKRAKAARKRLVGKCGRRILKLDVLNVFICL